MALKKFQVCFRMFCRKAKYILTLIYLSVTNSAVNHKENPKENFADNHFDNILRLFDVLPNFPSLQVNRYPIIFMNMVYTNCLASCQRTEDSGY